MSNLVSPQNSWARAEAMKASQQRDEASDPGLMGAAIVTALLAVAEALLAIESRLMEANDIADQAASR